MNKQKYKILNHKGHTGPDSDPTALTEAKGYRSWNQEHNRLPIKATQV